MGLIQSVEGLIKQQAYLSQARRKAAADNLGLDLYQLIPCFQPAGLLCRFCTSHPSKLHEPFPYEKSNCGTGEDSWESLRLQGDQTHQP